MPETARQNWRDDPPTSTPRPRGATRVQSQFTAAALHILPLMLLIGIILFGMLIGAAAQFIIGKPSGGIDWTLAIVAGLVGSFVGGLLISLITGHGIEFHPSGIIGSLAGALIVTAGWQLYARKRAA